MAQVFGIYEGGRGLVIVETNFRVSDHRDPGHGRFSVMDAIGESVKQRIGEKAYDLLNRIFALGGINDVVFDGPFIVKVYHTRAVDQNELAGSLVEMIKVIHPNSHLNEVKLD